MKMVRRSQSVPCTEIFLVLSGIQVDQLQNAIIHFMAEAGLSLKEGFRWTFQKSSDTGPFRSRPIRAQQKFSRPIRIAHLAHVTY